MASLTVVSVYLLFHSFTNTYADNSLNKILFNGDYEFIDLTYPFDNQTIYWPDSKEFEFTKKLKAFSVMDHGTPRMNLPLANMAVPILMLHTIFSAIGQHVGQIPLEKLIVPLIIVDLVSKVNDDANFVLYKHHLDYMLNNMGKSCLIVFKFGWSKFASDKKKYLGINDGRLNFPSLSPEVAEWITSSYKNVIGIGVDVASVDPGSSTDFAVHKILSRAGLYNIENVYFDRQIPDYGCTALVMPMKIALGTGAPLRLVAICPKQAPKHFLI